MTPPFERFVKNPYPGRLITFDPGETTGYSIWDNAKLTECGQLATHTVQNSVEMLSHWLDDKFSILHDEVDVDIYTGRAIAKVVIEEYRVYSQKTDDHAQSTMHTSRLIGCLETLLTLRKMPYEMVGAGLAKRVATDEKLKDWGFWQRGERHARDAIRHGVYFYWREPK